MFLFKIGQVPLAAAGMMYDPCIAEETRTRSRASGVAPLAVASIADTGASLNRQGRRSTTGSGWSGSTAVYPRDSSDIVSPRRVRVLAMQVSTVIAGAAWAPKVPTVTGTLLQVCLALLLGCQ